MNGIAHLEMLIYGCNQIVVGMYQKLKMCICLDTKRVLRTSFIGEVL